MIRSIPNLLATLDKYVQSTDELRVALDNLQNRELLQSMLDSGEVNSLMNIYSSHVVMNYLMGVLVFHKTKLRKLSEILEIVMQFNRSFTDNEAHSFYMCKSAIDTCIADKITGAEMWLLIHYIVKHIQEINSDAKPNDTLVSNLVKIGINFSNSPSEIRYLVFSCILDKLKSHNL